MKEATGELNLTVITVIAIAAIAAIFYAFVWPSLKVNIVRNTCEATCGKNNGCEAITRSNVDDYDADTVDFSDICTEDLITD